MKESTMAETRSARVLTTIAMWFSGLAVVVIAILLPMLTMSVNELQMEFDADFSSVKV
jgi:hypothetical protein